MPPNCNGIHRIPYVLIVDDDKDILKMVQYFLEQKKIFCKCAESLQEARTLAANEFFDVAIVDLHLEGESGVDIVKWFPVSKVVFMTGYDKEQKKLESLGYDIKVVLRKPIKFEELTKSITTVIEDYTMSPGDIEKAFFSVIGTIRGLKASNTRTYTKMKEFCGKMTTFDEELKFLKSGVLTLNNNVNMFLEEKKLEEFKKLQDEKIFISMALEFNQGITNVQERLSKIEDKIDEHNDINLTI